MSKSSDTSTKPAWHVWICMHIHSFISCSFPSANRITSSITTTTSTASSSHGSPLHLALLLSFFLFPPHLSSLSALIHPTHPASAWRRCSTSHGRPFGGRPLWRFPSRPSKTCRSSSSTSASSSSACCSSTSLSC